MQSWISHYFLSPTPTPANHSCFSICSPSITSISVHWGPQHFNLSDAGPHWRASISFPKLSNALNDISNIDLKFSVMYSMGGFHNSNFLMDNRIKGSLLYCNAREKELLIYPSSSFQFCFVHLLSEVHISLCLQLWNIPSPLHWAMQLVHFICFFNPASGCVNWCSQVKLHLQD